MSKQRSRGWIFIWNNYTHEDILYLQKQPFCKYLVYSKKINLLNTPYLQGYVHYNTLKSFGQVVLDFKDNYIERKSWEEAVINYLKKDDRFVKRGSPPLTKIQKGKKIKDFLNNQFKMIKENKQNEINSKIQNQIEKNPLDYTSEDNYWYYGPKDVDKNEKAREDLKNPYLKLCNQHWNNYQMEENVLIEDFNKRSMFLLHHLKMWSDKYPFYIEIKNKIGKIRPKRIIVTSNYHPKDIWKRREDYESILRRFKIKFFS